MKEEIFDTWKHCCDGNCVFVSRLFLKIFSYDFGLMIGFIRMFNGGPISRCCMIARFSFLNSCHMDRYFMRMRFDTLNSGLMIRKTWECEFHFLMMVLWLEHVWKCGLFLSMVVLWSDAVWEFYVWCLIVTRETFLFKCDRNPSFSWI